VGRLVVEDVGGLDHAQETNLKMEETESFDVAFAHNGRGVAAGDGGWQRRTNEMLVPG
jgi:hypothetical protein